MSDKLAVISKLEHSFDSRCSYIRAKINVLVPAQLRALRLTHNWTQKDLADKSDMRQSRISATECPGAVNFNMDTLVRLAAAHGVGLMVRFVPFSEMLNWENSFNQDNFTVASVLDDVAFHTGRPSADFDAIQKFVVAPLSEPTTDGWESAFRKLLETEWQQDAEPCAIDADLGPSANVAWSDKQRLPALPSYLGSE